MQQKYYLQSHKSNQPNHPNVTEAPHQHRHLLTTDAPQLNQDHVCSANLLLSLKKKLFLCKSVILVGSITRLFIYIINHAGPKRRNLKTWSTITDLAASGHAFNESPPQESVRAVKNLKMSRWRKTAPEVPPIPPPSPPSTKSPCPLVLW